MHKTFCNSFSKTIGNLPLLFIYLRNLLKNQALLIKIVVRQPVPFKESLRKKIDDGDMVSRRSEEGRKLKGFPRTCAAADM